MEKKIENAGGKKNDGGGMHNNNGLRLTSFDALVEDYKQGVENNIVKCCLVSVLLIIVLFSSFLMVWRREVV